MLRPFSTTTTLHAEPVQNDFTALNARGNDTAPEYRRFQIEKPLVPHMTNTTSTIANELPSIGADNPPPELLTNVDPNFVPKDSKPENTDRMTGGTQKPAPEGGVNSELNVGEIEGGMFRVEPLRRTGEDANTMRARLICKHEDRSSDLVLTLILFLRSKPEKRHARVRPAPVHLRRYAPRRHDALAAAAVRFIS